MRRATLVSGVLEHADRWGTIRYGSFEQWNDGPVIKTIDQTAVKKVAKKAVRKAAKKAVAKKAVKKAVKKAARKKVAKKVAKKAAKKAVRKAVAKRVVKKARPARPGRNPQTGEDIMIPAKPEQTVPKAYAVKALKEVVK